jgi:hypothetical protein
MESNSESPIIIQMLKNVKNIIEVSKGRDCWTPDELECIKTTYHNVSEILKQLQEREGQTKRFEEIKEDDKKLDESVEQVEEMDEVD